MNFKDYKFEIGDTVITTFGEIGKIVGFCTCERCAERGYFEPMWMKFDGDNVDYITIYEAEIGFSRFYQIGKYYFNSFDKDTVIQLIHNHEKDLKHLKDQLAIIEEKENEGKDEERI